MSSRFSPIVVFLALASFGALAACGGTTTPTSGAPATSAPAGSSSTPGGSSGAPASSLQACTALSQADAASITGDQSVAAQSSETAGLDICIYLDVSSGSGSGSEVAVLVEPAPGLSAAIIQAALASEAKNGSNSYQPVSGIGDVAYAETSTNEGDLAFVKGNTLVVLIASSPNKSGADLLSAIEQKGKDIAGQL